MRFGRCATVGAAQAWRPGAGGVEASSARRETRSRRMSRVTPPVIAASRCHRREATVGERASRRARLSSTRGAPSAGTKSCAASPTRVPAPAGRAGGGRWARATDRGWAATASYLVEARRAPSRRHAGAGLRAGPRSRSRGWPPKGRRTGTSSRAGGRSSGNFFADRERERGGRRGDCFERVEQRGGGASVGAAPRRLARRALRRRVRRRGGEIGERGRALPSDWRARRRARVEAAAQARAARVGVDAGAGSTVGDALVEAGEPGARARAAQARGRGRAPRRARRGARRPPRRPADA